MSVFMWRLGTTALPITRPRASRRSLNLAPLKEISRAIRATEPGNGVVNLWGNILVFVPIGALALLSMRNRTWTAVVLAFTAGVRLSVAIGVLGARLALRVRRRALTSGLSVSV